MSQLRPTNYPNGISNVSSSNGVSRRFPGIYRPETYENFHDFTQFTPDHWKIDLTAGGTTLLGETETAGYGALRLTTHTAANSAISAQWKGDAGRSVAVPDFLLTAAKAAYFTARFSMNTLASSQFFAGLLTPNTTPFGSGNTNVAAPLASIADGAFFAKSGNNLVFITVKNGVFTQDTVASLVDNVYVKAEFNYNAEKQGAIEVWVNDKLAKVTSTTTFPDDKTLALSFGAVTTAAAARVFKLDYLGAYTEAPNR